MTVTQFLLHSCACGLTLSYAFTSLAEEKAAAVQLPEGYIAEAPLPQGFPAPSEPGKVVEKTYPVIRSYSASGAGAFMKCFVYLSAKGHKMTAPVVMDLPPAKQATESAADKPAMVNGAPVPMVRMHFLLEENSLDKPRRIGGVQVTDIPALRVLSIAFQGKATAAKVKEGQEAIATRLSEMPDSQVAGEYRLLGYNSPMIERDKSYWELQLPIKDKIAGQ